MISIMNSCIAITVENLPSHLLQCSKQTLVMNRLFSFVMESKENMVPYSTHVVYGGTKETMTEKVH